MARYSHVFEIAFSVETDEADGNKVTADELWAALRERLRYMSHEEICEASHWCPAETVDEEST